MAVPNTGDWPVNSITATNQYTGTVTWNPNHSTFATNTTYTATITLTARTGYTFQGVPANFFTVAGATSVTNTANSGVVRAVFPPVLPFGGGTGTSNDPYIIQNGSQFQNIPLYSRSCFILANDINIADGSNIAPLASFYGVLNGNGKWVTYNQVVGNDGPYGLFQENFGLIQDMDVLTFIYGAISPSGMVYVGGIAGKNTPVARTSNTGKIVNCRVSGVITIKNLHVYGGINNLDPSITSDYPNVGGIVGRNTGIISNCSYEHYRTFSRVYNGFFGGIAGKHSGGSITGCSNLTTIIVHSNSDSYFKAGQIVGCTDIRGAMSNNNSWGYSY